MSHCRIMLTSSTHSTAQVRQGLCIFLSFYTPYRYSSYSSSSLTHPLLSSWSHTHMLSMAASSRDAYKKEIDSVFIHLFLLN